MKRILLLSTIWVGLTVALNAQSHFLQQEQHQQSVALSYGLRPNMGLRATYTRQWPKNLPLALSASLETSLTQSLGENYAVQLGGQYLLKQKRRYALTGELSLSSGHLETKIYKANKWELNETLLAGWHGRRTGIALMASFSQNLGTHLKHSDFYRETAYAEAKDGWYGGFRGYWQAGFRFNQLLWNRLDLTLQAAYASSSKGNRLGPLPIMAQLGGSWRF